MPLSFPTITSTGAPAGTDSDESLGSLLSERRFPAARRPEPIKIEMPPAAPEQRPAYAPEGDLSEAPRGPQTWFGASEQSGNYQFVQRIDTPLSETLETSFDESRTRLSMAVSGALKDEYQALIAETEKATGQRLFNPYSESGFGRREILERRERGEDVAGLGQQAAAIERFHRDLAELGKSYPDLPLRSHDDIIAKVQQDRADVRKRRADAAAGESGFLSGAAAFVGSTGAAFTDPINIVTLPMGAPWAAGILRVVATEAAIGLASEAAVQTSYQISREQIGERADAGEAVSDVLAVGATAGALGGAVRGVARGVEYIRDRRANLGRAETIPAAERTPDLEAAIAVERRALDIEERNPYGHADAADAAVHAQRYGAAERAIERGEVKARPEDAGPALRLSDADAAAIRDLATLARDPVAFAARIETFKAIPREAVEQAETLADFIRREGGISEPAIATAGIDPAQIVREFPGLVARSGKSIDELAQRAADEGYFPAKPAPDEFAAALAGEVLDGRTVRRIVAEELPRAIAENARVISALRRAGVDLDTLEPSQAAARLRTMAERIEQQQPSRQATAAPAVDPDGAAKSDARTQAAEASTAAEREAELDAIREQQIREEFAGREDTRIMIEDEDGTLRPMSIREIFEQDAREASELEALHLCVAGGVRKSAGITGATKKIFGA